MKRASVRERLEARIVEALQPFFHGRKLVAHIYGAQGFYRTRFADVMSWTGNVEIDGGPLVVDVGSWDTMTECLRGCTVQDCRGQTTAYADFEFHRISL